VGTYQNMIETHWLMDDLIIIRVESTVREVHEIKGKVSATVWNYNLSERLHDATRVLTFRLWLRTFRLWSL